MYASMEFTGEVIDNLPMYGRFTMANMAIEAGAKNGIFYPDSITEQYVNGRAKRKYHFYDSDKDAPYKDIKEFDVSMIEPRLPFHTFPVIPKEKVTGTVFIDQAVIGSCTNGRLDDLRTAAGVLKGHKTSSNLKPIIIPATPVIYRQAMKEGLFDIFLTPVQ